MHGAACRVIAGIASAAITVAPVAGGALAQDRGARVEALSEAADDPVMLTADELTYDREADTVTAAGKVEINQAGRILLADSVIYHRTTGNVVAKGNVSLLEPTGDVVFADYVELTDRMRDGVVEHIRIRMADDSRFAANYARRTDGNRTVMSRAVYSPCELCESDPTRAPLWQVKAAEVTHDQAAQEVEYKDAFLEMWGVPVLYTPYLAHPDPTVVRRSGLLAPTWGSDTELGYLLKVPYYYTFGPDEDVTIAPIVASKKGLVMSGEYRRLFEHGRIEMEGSGAVIDRREGDTIHGDEFRGHIKVRGGFDFDETWRSRFDIGRATDKTYLRKLDFENPSTLRSTAKVEGFTENSYTAISAFTVQELRDDVSGEATPSAAPNFWYNFATDPGAGGQIWTIDANALALYRGDGPESRRVSVQGGWNRPFRTAGGHLFEVALTMRGDLYSVNDVPDENGPPGDTFDGSVARLFPQAVADWRYPLARSVGNGTIVIEPRASVVASPNGQNTDHIPNEDSLDIEFDDANLFLGNRYPGLDRVDGGIRFNYGTRAGLYGDDGRRAVLTIGQSVRTNDRGDFPDGSGLEDQLSDVVGSVVVSPGRHLDLLYRFRFDKDDLTARRSELGLRAGIPEFRIDADYVRLKNIRTFGDLFEDREQVNAMVSSRFTRDWSGFVRHQRDLTGNEALLSQAGVRYSDECFLFEASFTRSHTSDSELRRSDALLFRLVFKNLGEISSQQGLGEERRTAPMEP